MEKNEQAKQDESLRIFATFFYFSQELCRLDLLKILNII